MGFGDAGDRMLGSLRRCGSSGGSELIYSRHAHRRERLDCPGSSSRLILGVCTHTRLHQTSLSGVTAELTVHTESSLKILRLKQGTPLVCHEKGQSDGSAREVGNDDIRG